MKNRILAIILVSTTLAIQACNSTDRKKNDEDSMSGNSTIHNSIAGDSSAMDANLSPQEGADCQTFMEQAAVGGMMEIEAGKLAAHKSNNSKVKEFARLMIKDHTQVSKELQAIAKDKQVSLPESLPAKEQHHLDKMKELRGSAFDKRYMEMMVKDHDGAVDLFKAATSSSDSQISAFATKTLKVIEGHNKKAHKLNEELK